MAYGNKQLKYEVVTLPDPFKTAAKIRTMTRKIRVSIAGLNQGTTCIIFRAWGSALYLASR